MCTLSIWQTKPLFSSTLFPSFWLPVPRSKQCNGRKEQLPQALWSFFIAFFSHHPVLSSRFAYALSYPLSIPIFLLPIVSFSRTLYPRLDLSLSLSLRSELNPTIISISPSITASRIFLELRIYSAAKLLPPELFLLVVEIWSTRRYRMPLEHPALQFCSFSMKICLFFNMIFMDYGRLLPYWQNS